MSDVDPVADVPLGFYCEHTQSKSRVLALVSRRREGRSLQAVLTCADPEIAKAAAAALSAAWFGAAGPATKAEAERVLALLPAAPAASLRNRLDEAFTGTWSARSAAQSLSTSASADLASADDEMSAATTDCLARTPSEARLSELAGPVVRITSMLEFHIHEPERLLKAARATGWTPFDDVDDDPNDLVGAVMALADPPSIPGTDDAGNEMSGELLIASQGDELADWSSLPISAHFSAGWRLQQHVDDRTEPLPDFAKLFETPECFCDLDSCETCGEWHLTPRTADHLYRALHLVADQAADDLDELGDLVVSKSGDWQIFGRLPRITFARDQVWRSQFVDAARALAGDLAAGERPEPRCFGEEMALHLALEDAPDFSELDMDDAHEALPERLDDYSWDTCSDALFQDHDILWLFKAEYDGVEDPSSDFNRKYAVGDMRPAAWFQVFNNQEPRV